MNDSQLSQILEEYTDDIYYVAPEKLRFSYHYIKSVDAPIIVILHENCEAFKNRVDGTIKDNWLSKEKFGNIASHCISVMEKLDGLEDWQHKLIDTFYSFTGFVKDW